MKRIFTILSLIVLLAGCCTEANYQRLLNSRLDMPEDELIAQIGNPTSVYDTNGKRSLEYKYSNFFCNQYGCYTNWCTTQYFVENNKISYWRYNGNHCCATK
ncbi:predicted protein [Proteobacteria bacterium CAG:495]|nr:predicted protein [Proteobacteria bacterium CAG:495]